MNNSALDREGIAIVGMSGRFPGANNLDEFWQNLKNGVESITRLTDEELIAAGVEASKLADPNYVKARATLADIDLFDAAFFGFNPKEAELTDPQHRLFLECAWEAVERAGYNPDTYGGRIGTFAGTGWNSYLFTNLRLQPNLIASAGVHQALIASDKDFLTTRVSYQLNLTGPSLDIQTSCSTSLVSVALACQSLLSYQCDMALAGGVTIFTPQNTGYAYQEGGILSPDGHCRAFDAKASGTVIGNGVGIVVLKRLEEALADGDCIHAAIKGAAINNDGSYKVGYTAPSMEGQAEVIAEALAFAGIDPETIGYIEAHGTGTALGDPIEIAALKQTFAARTQRQGFCGIGSVKTNIGHLDAAAGIAGLIKTVLALQHRQIPASLHFESPNPQIDFANSPFYINSTLREWQASTTPRRAGVSSFGIGGTNAHVILEEAPTIAPSGESRPWQLLMLAAKTPTALHAATENLAQYLQQHGDCQLADVAYTLQVGRKAFPHRRVILCHDSSNAVEAIASGDPQRVFTSVRGQFEPAVAFMFPGQGAQYPNMGAQLYQTEPIFRTWVDRCCNLLYPHLGCDLRQMLYPTIDSPETAAEKLQQTAIAQPALFAIEYALVQLWMAWGIQPQAAIGHSIGEYVAACLAGVFSLEDALQLVALRGQLMQQCAPGAMLSVFLSAAEVQAFLPEEMAISASNSPSACVVSGSLEAIADLQNRLQSQGIECHRLRTSHAFHSPMMEAIVEPFTAQVQRITLNPPTMAFISNLTGTWIAPEEATDPHYWAKHLRHTIRFADGIGQLLEDTHRILLEVGPGRTLSTLAKQHPKHQGITLTSLRHPQERDEDQAFLLRTLGRLWGAGVQVDWSSFYRQERRHRLPLPTYPFERQRHWIEALPDNSVADEQIEGKLTQLEDWFYIPSWKRTLNLSSATPAQKSRWLVFVDASGIGSQLVERLRSDRFEVIVVGIAETFKQLDERSYTLNPQQLEDYCTLIKLLKIQRQIPDAIAHLWGLAASWQPDLGFSSLIFLARALDAENITAPMAINAITDRAYEISGDEILSPENATVLAACKAIPQEYPHLSCRQIDAIYGEPNRARLVEQLTRELLSDMSDLAVAYRGNYRWVQIFEPVPLPATLEAKTRLKPEGIYLISGALINGVGLAIAEHLAETLHAKIILLGDAGLPVKEQWEGLDTSISDDIAGQIQRLQKLEQLGAEFLILKVDLTDAVQVKAAIARAIDRCGGLDGVIHAGEIAMQDAVCSLSETNRERWQRLWGLKVKPLLVLEQALRDRELDVWLIQSSLSSVLGGLGYAAYSAVNQFVDTFVAQQNRHHSTAWMSVNWDAWQLRASHAESDRELAQNLLASTPSIAATSSQYFMTLSEGITALRRILAMEGATQVIVSTGDLSTRLARWVQTQLPAQQPQELGKDSMNEGGNRHSRPNLQSDYAAPRNETERAISDIWQELLGVERVGIHDNFFELGGHSLLAIRGVSKIREFFQVDLPLRSLLFESPTVAKLANVIAQKQGNRESSRMEAVLKEIEDLSPDEVRERLSQD